MNKCADSSNLHWHSLTVEEVEQQLSTDLKRGLSHSTIAGRQAKHGPNILVSKKSDGGFKRFLLQFNQALVYILLTASLVTLVLGEFVDAGVIFFVILVNGVVGYLQESKAIKAIEALAKTIKTECLILRGGTRSMIDSSELVPGDVVFLQSGDKVPADLRLFRTKELQVEEAALTGESLPVSKRTEALEKELALGDRSNLAFASTLVTYGSGAGVVINTGNETEVGRISSLLAGAVSLETPLTRKIRHFSKFLLVIILMLSAATFAVGFLRGHALIDIFMAAVALAVAAIPEGLPAAITIMLAIGVNRMAQRHAIIRKLPAVEALGSTTVICSDKTGTLTQNQMTVEQIYAGNGFYKLSGSGYDPEGEFNSLDTSILASENKALEACVMVGALCNDAILIQENGVWDIDGDPTEGALLVVAIKNGLDPDTLKKEWSQIDVIPFESQHAYMATLCVDPVGSENLIAWKGSIESAIKRCGFTMAANGQLEPFDEESLNLKSAAMGTVGMRVLALASKRVDSSKQHLDRPDVDSDMVFLGLQGMIDPPRPEVVEAIHQCQTAGLTVKMITGDHMITAEAIAIQIGISEAAISPSAERESTAINGTQLALLSEQELIEVVRDKHVFARTSPEQKLRLVEALQADGQIVAMTGDGVNDAPALKRANIGIAMGIRGTEVSKEASDIILADDNFASIVAAVEEGRGVFRNLVKFITWTLPTNVAEALVILAAVALGTALPVLPVQILWINMSTSILLGMMLAFEPKDRDIMKRQPRDPKIPILTKELLIRIAFVGTLLLLGTYGVFLFEIQSGMEIAMAQTLAVNILVFGEIFYLFTCRSLSQSMFRIGLFSNKRLLFGVGAMITLQFVFTYLPPVQALFHTDGFPAVKWLWVIGIGITIYCLVEIEKGIRRRVGS